MFTCGSVGFLAPVESDAGTERGLPPDSRRENAETDTVARPRRIHTSFRFPFEAANVSHRHASGIKPTACECSRHADTHIAPLTIQRMRGWQRDVSSPYAVRHAPEGALQT